MIVRSYNPIERGQPAIWLNEPIREAGQVTRLARRLREYPAGDEPIDIVIAGGGGDVVIGLEMYTLLREQARRKRITIFDAPSMSGVIAMAGDQIRIVEGGTILLHHARIAEADIPTVNGYCPAALLDGFARKLRRTDAVHASIFSRRTGLPVERIAAMRGAETTLGADEAVRLGFADEVIRAGP